jgi:hypothetical protein
MGAVTFGAPRDFARAIAECFDLRCFVETGTNEGETAAWAATQFESVQTVEASPVIYERAKRRLSSYTNVNCHFGGSPQFIRNLIQNLPRSLFWLDAHWCAGETAGISAECPLIPELLAISPYLNTHAILIDDARFFLKPAPAGHQYLHWPSLDDIYRAIQATNQTFSIVHADTILILPATYRIRASEMMMKLG